MGSYARVAHGTRLSILDNVEYWFDAVKFKHVYLGIYLPEMIGSVIYRSDLLSLLEAMKYFPIYPI